MSSLPWAQTVATQLESELDGRQLLYLPGSPEFTSSEKDYFTAAACEVQSAAVARPSSAADVSTLLKILRRHLPADTPIAVRGAGHATAGGTAKAAGGVTIDMRGLRGIEILPGSDRVRIAAGEIWVSVFAALEAHEPPLTTLGGRMPGVGVVGFLLGGGLSNLSGRFGFGADFVDVWEVVLASGEVVRADRNNSDTAELWDALRGGSTNFGIVTAVEMRCFPHPPLFRGTTAFYLPMARRATLKALVDFAAAPSNHQRMDSAMWCITNFFGLNFINALLTTTGRREENVHHDLIRVWGRIPFTGNLYDRSHGKFVEDQAKLAPKNGSR